VINEARYPRADYPGLRPCALLFLLIPSYFPHLHSVSSPLSSIPIVVLSSLSSRLVSSPSLRRFCVILSYHVVQARPRLVVPHPSELCRKRQRVTHEFDLLEKDENGIYRVREFTDEEEAELKALEDLTAESSKRCCHSKLQSRTAGPLDGNLDDARSLANDEHTRGYDKMEGSRNRFFP
jgi:hypothetical protein